MDFCSNMATKEGYFRDSKEVEWPCDVLCVFDPNNGIITSKNGENTEITTILFFILSP